MQGYSFVNFHTHSSPNPNEIIIQNVRASERESIVCTENFISVGIHPWDVHLPDLGEQWKYVEAIAQSSHALTIGETGLDRNAQASLEQQTEVFKKHIQLAESLQKPLILHCVKAFSELIQIKKHIHTTIPWIIHGYTNNLTVARQLQDHGFYFSLGIALQHPNSNAMRLLQTLPSDRFFLETDDKTISIKKIYQSAAHILNKPIDLLTEDIFKRVTLLFPQIH